MVVKGLCRGVDSDASGNQSRRMEMQRKGRWSQGLEGGRGCLTLPGSGGKGKEHGDLCLSQREEK